MKLKLDLNRRSSGRKSQLKIYFLRKNSSCEIKTYLADFEDFPQPGEKRLLQEKNAIFMNDSYHYF
jgi:hypothetical protein